jgi:hypothetical protein
MKSSLLAKIGKVVSNLGQPEGGNISEQRKHPSTTNADVKGLEPEEKAPRTVAEIVDEVKRGEVYQGSSSICKLFALLELEELGLKQVEMADLLVVSGAYVSTVLKFRDLPDEILVMGHQGTRGKRREIPVDNINRLKVLEDEEGNILPITYKKLKMMSQLLPKKNDKSFVGKAREVREFLLLDSILRAATEMDDPEFGEFLIVEFKKYRQI